MAQAFSPSAFIPGRRGFIAQILVTLTTEPYTNGATGLTLTLPADVMDAITNNFVWADLTSPVIASAGSGGQGVVITRSATPGQFNVRLYNGTTELITGNVTFSFSMLLTAGPTVL